MIVFHMRTFFWKLHIYTHYLILYIKCDHYYMHYSVPCFFVAFKLWITLSIYKVLRIINHSIQRYTIIFIRGILIYIYYNLRGRLPFFFLLLNVEYLYVAT